MYIWHLPIIEKLNTTQYISSLSGRSKFLTISFMTFILSSILALISYLTIEKPGIDIGKRIIEGNKKVNLIK